MLKVRSLVGGVHPGFAGPVVPAWAAQTVRVGVYQQPQGGAV